MRAGDPQGAPALTIRALAAAIAAATLAAVAGCGGSEQERGTTQYGLPPRLAPADAGLIRKSRVAVNRYCRGVAENLAGEGPGSGARDQRRVLSLVRRLGALARREPRATDRYGVSADLALGDLAEDLEGVNCDFRLQRRIEAELAAVERGSGGG